MSLDDDFLAFGNDEDEGNDGDNAEEAKREAEKVAAAVSAALGSDSELPPWMDAPTDYRRTNPVVALHNEIVGFCKLMEPRAEEMKFREDLLEKFTKLIRETFGDDCEIDLFGSQVTGLCLPTSDIDIAIQLKEDKEGEYGEGEDSNQKGEADDLENWDAPSGSPLRRLGDALRDKWIQDLSYLEVVENTRVPVVKFDHAPTGISVDVCFNQKSGPQAAMLMKQYMNALPPLRPLTFVLKFFLASRDLNKPYTGGVGSYMLQLMILSFLQQRERDSYNFNRPSMYNLGALLVEFFELYSTDYNFFTAGISVRFDGFYFPKGATDRKESFYHPNRPFTMAIENPLDPEMDVGVSSFRIQTVQRSFEVAFKKLLTHLTEPAVPTVSILQSILPVTEEMNGRSTLTRPSEMEGGKQAALSGEPPKKRRRKD